jgi:hypothetical protein
MHIKQLARKTFMPEYATLLDARLPIRPFTEGRATSTVHATMLDSLADDWDLVRDVRVNMLLHGPNETMLKAIAALRPNLLRPVVTRAGRSRAAFTAPHRGTLVLAEVGALSLHNQHRLLAWLDADAGRTQVIATTSTSLLPLMDAGAFLEALYYRLNIVYLDLTGGAAPLP